MIEVVVGPPFSGKSQAVEKAKRAGDLVIDTTPLWRTLYSPLPGRTREYVEAEVVRAGMYAMAQRARDLELDGYVIIANRSPAAVRKWLVAAKGEEAVAAGARALLITEPMDVLIRRARKVGSQCEELLDGWDDFEEDAEFMDLVEPWFGEERAMIQFAEDDEFEAAYRQACESVSRRDECGEQVQQRCLTEDCELRAGAGDDSRIVSGIAVRYGDKAKLWGWTETIRAGALKLPIRASNLTMQHDRSLPVGLLEFEDSPKELRFTSELPAGMRQDQALEDIRSGLLRGASIEFIPEDDIVDSKKETIEITDARVLRLSLVDDGAYPKSKIKARACGCAAKQASQEEMIEAVIERQRKVFMSAIKDVTPTPAPIEKKRSYFF